MAIMKPIGNQWLLDTYGIQTAPLSHRSYLGGRPKASTEHGVVIEAYTQQYYPEHDTPLEHIEFALKYDDLNLDLLKKVFAILPVEDVVAYVQERPSGKYCKQIGYLYELLIGKDLTLAVPTSGSHVDLLDEERYVVAPKPMRSAKWRINDNLLGTAAFCPIVRKTPEIQALAGIDFSARIKEFQKDIPPELYKRALSYFYFKETKSTYEIEHEKASADKTGRFVATLKSAGLVPVDQVLDEAYLTKLQNQIVDPRYAKDGYRTYQNYVGQTMPGFRQMVHYASPPGMYVDDLMQGIKEAALKNAGAHPVVRAATTAFAFVFVHPFEDGNGRIHRFLIHDFLVRDKLVPEGMILPVSAYMLNNPQAYDDCLESYSKPLMRILAYDVDDRGVLTINNPDIVIGYYRYPDLTDQVSYLFRAVQQTIDNELVSEVAFLQHYDEARAAITEVVDMPDARLDKLMILLHQNSGGLSKSKRKLFPELTDDEVRRIEYAFKEAFDLVPAGVEADTGVAPSTGVASTSAEPVRPPNDPEP